jgi:sterol desaturase/sphingolipid hydroxylase (fatty acid hydroxylase superfamily)
MKYNFSAWTPLWDYLLGTMWDATDEKAQEKYARMKQVADRESEKDIRHAKGDGTIAVIVTAVKI